MMTEPRLPWHQHTWDYLIKRKNAQNLPHALMLQGTQGLGKYQFAMQFANLLMCKSPTTDNYSCGKCNSCVLFRNKSHPDFMLLAPSEPGKAILVDQVRKISRDLCLKSHIADCKVVIISPADQMNISASNSLLKTLEEPSSDTILMLLTDKPSRLSATVRSRCQKLIFQKPSIELAKHWLKQQVPSDLDLDLLMALSAQAPLKALELSDESHLQLRRDFYLDLLHLIDNKTECVSVAAKWNKNNCVLFLALMTSWVTDLIKLKFNSHKSLIDNTDFYPTLLNLINLIDIKSLFDLYDCIRKYAYTNNQLNSSLLFEDVLLRWHSLHP